MMIKTLNKKISMSLLLLGLSFPLLSSQNLYEATSQKYQVSFNNSVYTAQKFQDRTRPQEKFWFIKNNQVIGDDQSEKQLYKKLALTATIAEHINPRDFSSYLESQSNNYRQLAALAATSKISNFIISKTSELEGIIENNIDNLATGNPSYLIKDFVNQIVTCSINNFILNLEANLKYLNPSSIKAIDLNNLSKGSLEIQLVKSYQSLDKAKNILQNHHGNWSYEEASQFYHYWKTAEVYGNSSAIFIKKMNSVNWNNILNIIKTNREKGLNNEQNCSNVKNTLLNDPTITDIFETLKEEITRWNNYFKPIDNYFLQDKTFLINDLVNIIEKESKLRKISNNPAQPQEVYKSNQPEEYSFDVSKLKIIPLEWSSDSIVVGECKPFKVKLKNRTNIPFKGVLIDVTHIKGQNNQYLLPGKCFTGIYRDGLERTSLFKIGEDPKKPWEITLAPGETKDVYATVINVKSSLDLVGNYELTYEIRAQSEDLFYISIPLTKNIEVKEY